MSWDCPKCKNESTVETLYTEMNALCIHCGARFKVEWEGDYNGDHWMDCSTLGEEIKPDEPEQQRS